jgi:hypothetical protein
MNQPENRIKIPYQFKCRDYQIPAWKALDEGKKRVVCCWHRGAGKDLFALNYLIWRMVEFPAVYLHCFPKYNQGKRAIWNSVHQTDEGHAMSYLDHFPKEIVKYKNSSDMRLELTNGSIYCVMGIDGKNATQARGMNPSFIILSEYAYMDPESWYTIEPRISQNNGTALFLSTPNGQNHFYDLFNYAQSGHKPDYFSSKLTIEDTKVLEEDHLDKLRSEGIPEDFILQEYMCDFKRGAEGSYYGKLIQSARDDNRIYNARINLDLPCHTSWDIGIGDSSAIWIFQTLLNGTTVFLHYYQNNNEGLEHYIRYLDRWKDANKAVWGTHYVPHDMKNREFTSGVDRLSAARNMGYNMTIVPMKLIEEGIQACRSLIPHCSFHATECKKGIQCLDMYHKKWNDSLKVYYDEPLHDRWSHGADAFRMAAIGIKALGTQTTHKLSADSIKEMRQRNLGY